MLVRAINIKLHCRHVIEPNINPLCLPPKDLHWHHLQGTGCNQDSIAASTAVASGMRPVQHSQGCYWPLSRYFRLYPASL